MIANPRRTVTDQSPRVVNVAMTTEYRLLRILLHPTSDWLGKLRTSDRYPAPVHHHTCCCALCHLIVFSETVTFYVQYNARFTTIFAYAEFYRAGQKTAHGFLCNNFAYFLSFFIIFGTYTLEEICNRVMHS